MSTPLRTPRAARELAKRVLADPHDDESAVLAATVLYFVDRFEAEQEALRMTIDDGIPAW